MPSCLKTFFPPLSIVLCRLAVKGVRSFARRSDCDPVARTHAEIRNESEMNQRIESIISLSLGLTVSVFLSLFLHAERLPTEQEVEAMPRAGGEQRERVRLRAHRSEMHGTEMDHHQRSAWQRRVTGRPMASWWRTPDGTDKPTAHPDVSKRTWHHTINVKHFGLPSCCTRISHIRQLGLRDLGAFISYFLVIRLLDTKYHTAKPISRDSLTISFIPITVSIYGPKWAYYRYSQNTKVLAPSSHNPLKVPLEFLRHMRGMNVFIIIIIIYTTYFCFLVCVLHLKKICFLVWTGDYTSVSDIIIRHANAPLMRMYKSTSAS